MACVGKFCVHRRDKGAGSFQRGGGRKGGDKATALDLLFDAMTRRGHTIAGKGGHTEVSVSVDRSRQRQRIIFEIIFLVELTFIEVEFLVLILGRQISVQERIVVQIS